MTAHIRPALAMIALAVTIAGCSAGPASDSDDLATASGASSTPSNNLNLDDAPMKEIAMRLVSTAENSSTDWMAQYSYIEDIGDGRGYTAGIIGLLQRHRRHARTGPGVHRD